MSESRAAGRADHRPLRSIALVAIVLLAAGVRFWGIGFGLPHTQARPDETQIIDVTRKFLAGDLRPNFFDYPWLYMWVSTGLYLCYYLVGLIQGWFGSVADLVRSWPLHWEPFFLINRVLSATLGSLTVLAVFGTARRLWDRQTALVAAFFMALAFIHVRDSHFGTTDAMMTFFIVLSTMWLMDGHLTGRRRSFVLAGVMGGLATATKYNAGVIMFPVLVSQAAQMIAARRATGRMAFDGRMFWFGVPCAAAFLIGVPFLLFDYERFRAAMALLNESMNLGTGGVSASLGNGWLHHLRFSLFYGVGFPLLCLSLVAAVILLIRRTGVTIVLLTFPIVYFYVIGSVRNLFFRYAVPVVPFLCLVAAWAVVAFSRRLARSRGSSAPATSVVIMWALAVVIIAPSAMSAIRFDRIAAATDNRVVVARWFDDNIAPGASILQSGSSYGYVQFTPKRFDPWLWDGRRLLFTTLDRRPAVGNPDYILIQDSPLPNATQEQVTAYLAQGYRIEVQFKALSIDRPRVYDLQDAFYIPFADFAGVDRPGPNFTLYKHVH